MWIVNHKALLSAEVPLLRSLGYEVFIPKKIPVGPDFRSLVTTAEYDYALDLSSEMLDILNRHDFYCDIWPPTLEQIIADNFDVIISIFSAYLVPVTEAIRKFPGKVIVRPFGREHPLTYDALLSLRQIPGTLNFDYVDGQRERLLAEISAMGDRFVFGQGYYNIADIEPPEFQRAAHTLTLPLPKLAFKYKNTWCGGGAAMLFLCPTISTPYYRETYNGIKRHFGDSQHIILGRQTERLDDPAVLPYLSDDALADLYAKVPVFVYPQNEPRHLHYSPLEAIVIGTPTLYLKGTLIDNLTKNADLPGACENIIDMKEKAHRLLSGDIELADAIRARQHVVLDAFAEDLARDQWCMVLPAD